MEDATTVFLVRHATHDRVGRILCGRMADVSLSRDGREQATRLARRFEGLPIAAVMSSPLTRALETAAPIGASLGIGVDTCPDLQEIDFGEWTGRSLEELAPDPAWQRWNAARASGAAPGGESMADVQDRAVRAILAASATHPGGQILCVSHGDVLKAVVCWCLGLSLDRVLAFDLAPASVTSLAVWRGGAKLLGLNDLSAAGSAA